MQCKNLNTLLILSLLTILPCMLCKSSLFNKHEARVLDLIYTIKKVLLTVGGLALGASLASGAIYLKKSTGYLRNIQSDLASVAEGTKVWGDMPLEQPVSDFSFIAPALKGKKDYSLEISAKNHIFNGQGGGFYFGSRKDYLSGNLNLFDVNILKSKLVNIANTKSAETPHHEARNRMESLIEGVPVGAPVIGRLTSHFGRRLSPFARRSDFHTGVDIATDYNTPVVSSANGKVLFAGYKGSYGKTILIRHYNGIETLYAHLSRIEVKSGDLVHRGEKIGLLGTSGQSTGPHLHYEVRLNGNPINPKTYIEIAKILRSVG